MPKPPSRRPRPGLLTTTDLARELGINRVQILQYRADGKLKEAETDDRGTPHWDAEDVKRQWRANIRVRSDSPASILEGYERPGKAGESPDDRARLLSAQVRLAEVKASTAEGEVVKVDAVRRQWENAAVALRDSLMGLGSRLSDLLINQSDPREVRKLIDAEVRASLQTCDAALGKASEVSAAVDDGDEE